MPVLQLDDVVDSMRMPMQVALTALGVLICVLSAFQLWLPLVALMAAILIVPYIIVATKYPDAVIFLSILVVFTPFQRAVSVHFYMLLSLAAILFVKNSLQRKPIVQVDNVLLLFGVFFTLSLVSLYKWVDIHRGLRGSLSLFVLPTLLYVFFNNGYVSGAGVQRFFKYYFPLIYSYIVGQLLIVIFKGAAVTGYSFVEFHTGFNLGWGWSVFVSALNAFLMFLTIRTKVYWYPHRLIRAMNCLNFVVSSVVIVLIMARAPVVAFLGALLIYNLYRSLFIKHTIRIKISHVVYAAVISLVFYLGFQEHIEHLLVRFVTMRTDASFLIRVYMYVDGIETFIQNFVTGVGPDQHLFWQFFSAKETDPNNIFISYAVSFGVFGLLSISLLFLYPFVIMTNIHKATPEPNVKYMGSQLLPVLVFAVINSTIEIIITGFTYGSLFWTLYALFYRTFRTPLQNIGLPAQFTAEQPMGS